MLSSLGIKIGVVIVAALALVYGVNRLYQNGYNAGAAVERVAGAKRTEDAINEVKDQAERARAMRRYCRDSGMQYDFAAVKCRQN